MVLTLQTKTIDYQTTKLVYKMQTIIIELLPKLKLKTHANIDTKTLDKKEKHLHRTSFKKSPNLDADRDNSELKVQICNTVFRQHPQC